MSEKEAAKPPLTAPFRVESVPWEEWSHGGRFGSRFRALGAHGGATHVGVVLEELPPGKQSCPLHFHMLEEEQIWFPERSATLRLGEASHAVAAGDYVVFPAGQKAGHCLINNGQDVCRFLIIGDRNPNDVMVYPDSAKVRVRLLDENYRRSATVEYWEGEEGEP